MELQLNCLLVGIKHQIVIYILQTLFGLQGESEYRDEIHYIT